jgi:DHA1 family purine base/nucleoside efflux pump-like MFS transporter
MKRVREKIVLAALFVSRFAISSPRMIVGLLLIDIAASFSVSIGVMGQISTLSSLVGMITAFVMGVVSIRFRHKSLLLLGLMTMLLASVGCFASSNYVVMLISYSLVSLGGVIGSPMTSTLVASHFAIRRRAYVMGWLMAGGGLAVSLGAPIIAWIADWRLAFLGFVAPIVLLSFLLVLTGIPMADDDSSTSARVPRYRESFNAILRNESALACLLGTMLIVASFQAVFLYASSFFRQRYLISTEEASLFVFGGAMCVTIGGVLSGRFVNRLGRKRLVVVVGILQSVCIIAYAMIPSLWFATAARFIGSGMAGVMFSALGSLSLEQLPRFRGTMMSIQTAMQSVGSALGAGIGGVALVLYDYELVGISLGILAVIGAFIVRVFTVDPISDISRKS